jgi:hypothetical protein
VPRVIPKWGKTSRVGATELRDALFGVFVYDALEGGLGAAAGAGAVGGGRGRGVGGEDGGHGRWAASLGEGVAGGVGEGC